MNIGKRIHAVKSAIHLTALNIFLVFSIYKVKALDRQPVIIFVTGYEKYVYDAFDVAAFQYLLKPINEQKFAEVFSRAHGQILSGQILFGAEQKKKTLVIQCGSESRVIPLDSIYCLESRNHKVVLYLKEGELEYYAKIRDLEEELAEQKQFYMQPA